jgi:hypothetical protein
MGHDYSYTIFVPAGNVSRALAALGAVAVAAREPVSLPVTLPGGERITVPFTSRFSSDPVDCSGGENLGLDVVMLIDLDLDDDYARDYFEHDDAQARLGYLYLTVTFASGTRAGYASLDFRAATTSMSMLMDHSPSVEAAFVALAVASGGVCCWLEREWEWREVRWLNGEQCRDSIPGSRFATELEVGATWPDLG